MKAGTSISDELLTVLSQWYNQAVTRYQLMFPLQIQISCYENN